MLDTSDPATRAAAVAPLPLGALTLSFVVFPWPSRLVPVVAYGLPALAVAAHAFYADAVRALYLGLGGVAVMVGLGLGALVVVGQDAGMVFYLLVALVVLVVPGVALVVCYAIASRRLEAA